LDFIAYFNRVFAKPFRCLVAPTYCTNLG
jgi:hypothetical protein